ncbi:MAG: hypothetical protein IIV90_06080 [Oscillospiraceae bacterium]|nr:hypothetical protein [Oscillospiraceae bacterium]
MQAKNKKFLWGILAAFAAVAVLFYLACPALNIHEPGFWILAFLFFAVVFAVSLPLGFSMEQPAPGQRFGRLHFNGKPLKYSFIAMVVIAVVFFGGKAYGAPFFHARAYAQAGEERMTVGDFAADVPVVENGVVDDIAIMDTATASAMGKRQLGSLGTLATQYEMGAFMTTTVNDKALKVAPLGYGSFWKWFVRQDEGIPGYVAVDPVSGASSYQEFDQPMYYSNTAWFGKNITRHIRFQNPTALFNNVHFEVDNEGSPYWIACLYENRVGLFDCAVPCGVIVCDAVTGQCTRYAEGEIPDWVSIAYGADDLIRLVNYAGELGSGWLNSRMAKTGVYRTTDDYGYKVVNGHLNAFTGITSAASDESNIGFVLCDEHTGQITRYDVYGAEEYSAGTAAEGLVMNFGYRASFPSLVNVEGKPVYIMAMTDGGDLIKKYALVDLQDYTKVTVGDTVPEAWAAFVEKYSGGLPQPQPEAGFEPYPATFALAADPVLASLEGSSYLYLLGQDAIYRVKLDGAESLLRAKAGDILELSVTGELSGTAYDKVYTARFAAWQQAMPPETGAAPAQQPESAEATPDQTA